MRIIFLLFIAVSLYGFDFFGLFKKESVSLVLGSGGARGYAHIGVIEELEKKGLKIKSVSGSSMGALVGGLYAAGKLEEYKKWVISLGISDILNLVAFVPENGGLIKPDKVFEKLESIIGDVNIEDLPIKYTAVATNIMTQTEVRFTKGRLLDAIRASIAIPTIFTPVKQGDDLLVDGGVLNPLPINIVADDDNDYIIVVDIAANIQNPYDITIPESLKNRQKNLYDAIFDFFKNSEDAPQIQEKGVFYVMRKTLDTIQSELSRQQLEKYKVDLLIEISKDSCDFYEFNRAYEMIEIGRLSAVDALKRL